MEKAGETVPLLGQQREAADYLTIDSSHNSPTTAQPDIIYHGTRPTFKENRAEPEPGSATYSHYWLIWNTFVAKLEGTMLWLLENGFPLAITGLGVAYCIGLYYSKIFSPESIELRVQSGPDIYALTVKEIVLHPLLNALASLLNEGIPPRTFRINQAPTTGTPYCGEAPGTSEAVHEHALFAHYNPDQSGLIIAHPFTCEGAETEWLVNITRSIPPEIYNAMGISSDNDILKLRALIASIIPGMLLSTALYFRNPSIGRSLQGIANNLSTLMTHCLKMPFVFAYYLLMATVYVAQKMLLRPLFACLSLNRTALTLLSKTHRNMLTIQRKSLKYRQALPPLPYDRTFALNHGVQVAWGFESNLSLLKRIPRGEAVAGILERFSTGLNQAAKRGELNEGMLFGAIFGVNVLNDICAAANKIQLHGVTSVFDQLKMAIAELYQQTHLLDHSQQPQAFAEIQALRKQLHFTLKTLLANKATHWIKKHFSNISTEKLTAAHLKSHWPVLRAILIATTRGDQTILNTALNLSRSTWHETVEAFWLARYLGFTTPWLAALRTVADTHTAEDQALRDTLGWLYLDSSQVAALHDDSLDVTESSSTAQQASGEIIDAPCTPEGATEASLPTAVVTQDATSAQAISQAGHFRPKSILPDTALRLLFSQEMAAALTHFYHKTGVPNLLSYQLEQMRITTADYQKIEDTADKALEDLANITRVSTGNREVWLIGLRLLHMTRNTSSENLMATKSALESYKTSCASGQAPSVTNLTKQKAILAALLLAPAQSDSDKESGIYAMERIFATMRFTPATSCR